MPFEFYTTFVPGLSLQEPFPVTLPYSAPKKHAQLLKEYGATQFIHSGNWWTEDPIKRTRERILAGQQTLANVHTIGFMSKNEQAGDQVAQKGSNFKKGDAMTYWVESSPENAKYLDICLDNASWATDHNSTHVPIYCTLQVTNAKEAEFWFQRGLDAGHKHFAIGVSEFLRHPKYRQEGEKRLLEITIAARRILGNAPLHLSGASSYTLLPFLAICGASSTDGSTPVQSALAYGTVFVGTGRGVRASALKESDMVELCECPACKDLTPVECIKKFNFDRSARVVHNVAKWQKLMREINRDGLTRPEQWIPQILQKSTSKQMKVLWQIYSKILDDEIK